MNVATPGPAAQDSGGSADRRPDLANGLPLRLAVNLADLLGTGRFDQQQTAAQAAQITKLAADADFMQLAVDLLSPLRVELDSRAVPVDLAE